MTLTAFSLVVGRCFAKMWMLKHPNHSAPSRPDCSHVSTSISPKDDNHKGWQKCIIWLDPVWWMTVWQLPAHRPEGSGDSSCKGNPGSEERVSFPTRGENQLMLRWQNDQTTENLGVTMSIENRNQSQHLLANVGGSFVFHLWLQPGWRGFSARSSFRSGYSGFDGVGAPKRDDKNGLSLAVPNWWHQHDIYCIERYQTR